MRRLRFLWDDICDSCSPEVRSLLLDSYSARLLTATYFTGTGKLQQFVIAGWPCGQAGINDPQMINSIPSDTRDLPSATESAMGEGEICTAYVMDFVNIFYICIKDLSFLSHIMN